MQDQEAQEISGIAILGLGKLGGILLKAFLDEKLVSPARVEATVRHAGNAQRRSQAFGVRVGTDNRQAVRGTDIVLLCVKPGSVEDVCVQIADSLGPQQLLVSTAASVPTARIEAVLPQGAPVIRAMPNTPCVISRGMTGICAGKAVDSSHLAKARRLFEAVGRAVVVDEKQMDAVTGLSASGPAFMYIILESLAEAGVKAGLPRDVATLLAAQTAQGAAGMVLETGDHPALLKDAVTTPAGCTIDGILELEEGKLRVTLIKAVVKAAERARQLVDG